MIRKKKKETEVPVKKQESEYEKRNKKLNVQNPYQELLTVQDLLEDIDTPQLMLSNLEIVMLRYNSILNKLYKLYKARNENITSISFTLTLKTFWQFLREARVLSPAVSLASFDRQFYSCKYNRYNILFSYDEVREKMTKMKVKHFGSDQRKFEMMKIMDPALSDHNTQIQCSRIDYDNFDVSIKQVEEELESQSEIDEYSRKAREQSLNMKRKGFYIHNTNNPILFRNFVDGLIRMVYLREGKNSDELDKAVEKFMLYRIKPLCYSLVEKKKHLFSVGFQREEIMARAIISRFKLEENEELYEVFKEVSGLRVRDGDDVSMSVGRLINSMERAGHIKTINDGEEKDLLVKIVERYMDPDSTYTESRQRLLESKYLMVQDSLSLEIISNNTEKREEDARNQSVNISENILEEDGNIPKTELGSVYSMIEKGKEEVSGEEDDSSYLNYEEGNLDIGSSKFGIYYILFFRE